MFIWKIIDIGAWWYNRAASELCDVFFDDTRIRDHRIAVDAIQGGMCGEPVACVVSVNSTIGCVWFGVLTALYMFLCICGAL